MIRPASSADAKVIAAIYNYYVLHTHVTFEEEAVSPEDMWGRMAEIQKTYPWLVYEEAGSVWGYAYANKWQSRCSCRRTVETTVYLDGAKVRKGIGSQLYAELIRILKDGEFHTAIGGIALPNEGSVALHEKLGFTKTGHFTGVGRKFDRWIDVGYWQLML